MDTDQINGEWVPAEVGYEGINLWPEQSEGYAYRGLLLVPAYDIEDDMFPPNTWSVWHQASGEVLVDEIPGTLERAMAITAKLADALDWEAMDQPDVADPVIAFKLLAFALEFPFEVASHNAWMIAALDAEIPHRN